MVAGMRRAMFSRTQPVAVASAAATQPAVAATEAAPMNPSILNLLEKLLTLAPIIAYGVHTMKADATLGDKQTMAQDALNIAVAGAQATLPADQQGTVTAIGGAAQTVLSTILTTLHNGAQLAPAAS